MANLFEHKENRRSWGFLFRSVSSFNSEFYILESNKIKIEKILKKQSEDKNTMEYLIINDKELLQKVLDSKRVNNDDKSFDDIIEKFEDEFKREQDINDYRQILFDEKFNNLKIQND